MPTICIVVGCGSRSNRDEVLFYRVPAETKHRFLTEKNEMTKLRRAAWIAAIKRDNLTESILKHQKVCSRHFITGKAAALEDKDHPDWVPSQHMGHVSQEVEKRVADDDKENHPDKRRKLAETKVVDIDEIPQQLQDNRIESMETGESTQTELTMTNLSVKLDHHEFSSTKMQALELKLEKSPFGLMDDESDDNRWKYYTGFKYILVKIIFERVEPFVCSTSTSALSSFNQLLLTLIKLRLGLHYKDLAYRFKISASTASTYFEQILNILYYKFKSLIVWPDQPNLDTVPYCFKETFHEKTTVILDCFEVFIERPPHLLTQQQCWSNKHHQTIKFLIGITPQGSVCYLSDAWGGRTSDKAIVEHSSFCDKIKPGDVVIADRGFVILGVLQAKLVIPAYIRGKSQLHPLELEETRQIAHVRIHVERIIGMLKNKFHIFKNTIPITMVKKGTNEKVNMLDKAVTVCCAFINLCPAIIPL